MHGGRARRARGTQRIGVILGAVIVGWGLITPAQETGLPPAIPPDPGGPMAPAPAPGNGEPPAPTRPSPAVPPPPGGPAPPGSPAASGASAMEDRSLSATPSGPLGRAAGVVPLPLPGAGRSTAPPGDPPRTGRPRPGSIFNPGSSGPGISRTGEVFLDGALNPETGWPFVLLDHFAPRPERLESFWIVQTRACPQEMGTDPWRCLRVLHFDGRGNLVDRDPRELFAQTLGRPVFILVQGSLTTPDIALGGLLWSHSWLERNGALRPDSVVIAFDWPSQRIYRNDVRDINEKGRRAFVAAYHLARFVQGFPAGSRICLLGQSYGGRVVPAALHLLGGGCLNSQDHDPSVRLPALRPDLHLWGIVLAAASDHFWLNPGARLDRVLPACEGFLNLYNRRDEALRLYPFLVRSGHHLALGRLGLTNSDLKRLGPLAARYEEHDVDELLGVEHTLLDAVANRQIARWMAPYLGAPDPGPSPAEPETTPWQEQDRSRRGLRGLFR